MWFKKKKPWVRWYSVDRGVAELSPWFPAKQLKRPWRMNALREQGGRNREEKKCPALKAQRMWHRLTEEMHGRRMETPEGFTHAVTCPAMSSIMDSGYILPLPADVLIQTHGDGHNFEWRSQTLFSSIDAFVKAHPPEQTTGVRETFQSKSLDWTIKLELPWRVQAHPDVVFLQMPISYHKEDRFSVPTGIVDPKYSYEINLQLFWHKIEKGEYLMEAGTPLCQWIPMHRDFVSMQGWDVIIETANQEDQENNEIMDYQRKKQFLESSTLNERIDNHAQVLAMNKNKERFE
tara:strand:- start:5499 stop:6371 length:873 start_codon:yes stop_codon:yes gene_type:complete